MIRRREFLPRFSAARRRVAACGAGAAAGDAGGRISSQHSRGRLRPSAGSSAAGLREGGYDRGPQRRNRISWAEMRQLDRPVGAWPQLIHKPVAVIVGNGTAAPAKAATTTAPIVFVTGSDPSRKGCSPASTGPAATSPASASCLAGVRENGWSCCDNWCPARRRSAPGRSGTNARRGRSGARLEAAAQAVRAAAFRGRNIEPIAT